MSSLAIVDAGPLFAAADEDGASHEPCLQTLSRPDLRLVVPALVVAEASYFIAKRLGAGAEASFLAAMGGVDVEGPDPSDFLRMAELVESYSDFPLGGTDASVIALAERLDAPVIVTLERRHFAAVAPRHRSSFELLP